MVMASKTNTIQKEQITFNATKAIIAAVEEQTEADVSGAGRQESESHIAAAEEQTEADVSGGAGRQESESHIAAAEEQTEADVSGAGRQESHSAAAEEQTEADVSGGAGRQESESHIAAAEEQTEADVSGAGRQLLRKKRCAEKEKIRQLRKEMLSFEPPEKTTVFRRVIPPTEDSSDDEIIRFSKRIQKKSRKRVRNEDLWKRNLIKIARQKGEAYINHKGERVAAKHAPVDETLCRTGCKFKCNEHFDNATRSEVFDAYYALTPGAHDVYLYGCIACRNPKVCRNDALTHREVSVTYMTKVDGESVRVCKQAFMKLHRITQSKVDYIVSQGKLGLPAARQSLRGKHDNRPNKISEHRRELVREHVRRFPAEASHYSRHDNSNRLYLSPLLSINVMYNLYVTWAKDKGEVPVSSSLYRSIFCSDFNLGFGTPRSDTCSRCESLTGDQLDLHKTTAAHAFQQQKVDRDLARSGEAVYLTFDLEKTLPLPKLSIGEAFYLRQVWLYNAGIHMVKKDKDGAFFQIWTEDEGRRGVKEICSALYTFFTVSKSCDSTTDLIAWSDSCAGQNKNFKMLCFWQYLILTKHFRSIEHKFPIPGHTYLDSDRDFGKIEVAVKRRETIFSIDEYQTLMSNSVRNPKPTVTRIGNKMFDINLLMQEMGLKPQTLNVAGQKIELRDKVRWVRITRFGAYQYKHSFQDDETWKDVKLTDSVPKGVQIQMLPPTKIPIKAAKLKDITKQLELVHVPELFMPFYKNLTAATSEVATNDDEQMELEDVDAEDVEVCIHYFTFWVDYTITKIVLLGLVAPLPECQQNDIEVGEMESVQGSGRGWHDKGEGLVDSLLDGGTNRRTIVITCV